MCCNLRECSFQVPCLIILALCGDNLLCVILISMNLFLSFFPIFFFFTVFFHLFFFLYQKLRIIFLLLISTFPFFSLFPLFFTAIPSPYSPFLYILSYLSSTFSFVLAFPRHLFLLSKSWFFLKQSFTINSGILQTMKVSKRFTLLSFFIVTVVKSDPRVKFTDRYHFRYPHLLTFSVLANK